MQPASSPIGATSIFGGNSGSTSTLFHSQIANLPINSTSQQKSIFSTQPASVSIGNCTTIPQTDNKSSIFGESNLQIEKAPTSNIFGSTSIFGTSYNRCNLTGN